MPNTSILITLIILTALRLEKLSQTI